MTKQKNLIKVKLDECYKPFINNINIEFGKDYRVSTLTSLEIIISSSHLKLLYFGIFNFHEICSLLLCQIPERFEICRNFAKY